MYKILLTLLLCGPLLLHAQEAVKPIISGDYLSLINDDSLTGKRNIAHDSSKVLLRIGAPYPSSIRVRSVKERNGQLLILPVEKKWLSIGGNYTFSTGVRSVTAIPYDNSIFRTGAVTSHSLSLQAAIRKLYWERRWILSLKAGSSGENTVLAANHNSSRNISASAERLLKKYSFSGGYSYYASHFSNDNSNGFLNRVYQRTLQDPISFNNTQSFLLNNNGHFADRRQQSGNLSLKKKQGDLNFGVSAAFDAIDDNSDQSVKPGTAGTAFFSYGLIYTRDQTDRHYTSNAWISYKFRQGSGGYSSFARLNYTFNNEKVDIYYPASRYAYQRSSNDASVTFSTNHDRYDLAWGLNAGNKFYASNTSRHDKFFLPEISGYLSSSHLFDDDIYAKLAVNYTSFCSELPINRSLSYFMLTQLSPQEAYRFLPVNEVRTYNNLSAMQNQEFLSWLQLEIFHKLTFRAEYSTRDTKDNAFPTYDNGQLILKNLADTRYKSLELQLQFNDWGDYGKLRITNALSFYKFSNIVTHVQDGYDHQPIAGFSTIHKAIVKGQPLGVIVDHLVSNHPSIIGDPTPDYTLKFSHTASWKDLSINLDWEYRKGGDVWNGTAAMLDNHGLIGIPGSYIQKGNTIRIHTLSLSYDMKMRKYVQLIRLTAYAQGLLLWSSYKGVDPSQLLYDQSASAGLDFFNLPSTKTYGLSASIQL